MTERKPDAGQIWTFLDSLAKQDWVKNSARRNWPRFLFHYTDIKNVPTILRHGFLYSRTEAERLGVLRTSSGDPGILSETDPLVKNSVRLYFRPRTPTQYHAEGIRSQDGHFRSEYPEAHCPVPVFLLFDAADVLTRADSSFAAGNLRYLGRGVVLRSTAKDLKGFPWCKIYHNTSFDRDEEDIAFHRSAEVIVPKRLSLDALKLIFCRSEAEKDTLRALLSPDVWRRYQNKVLATQSTDLYFRKHTYVISARLLPNGCSFAFSSDSQSRNSFALRVEIESEGRLYRYEENDYWTSPELKMGLSRELSDYTIRLYLDDHLAYAGEYFDIPF